MTAMSLRVAQGRPLPQIFDRLVVILAVQSHLFGALVILNSRSVYRSLPASVALWVVSLAVPLACVVVARRANGNLSRRAFLVAAATLLVVDAAVARLIPPSELGSAAPWAWTVIGVTVLTFAAFRPPRDVLLLAAFHGLVAVLVLVPNYGEPSVDAFNLFGAVDAAVLPALAAARYLNLYIDAVRLREEAVAARLAIETKALATRAVQEDAARRLAALRAEIVPLLAQVANGTVAIDDEDTAHTARRLAGDLRDELVEGRSGRWLLEAPGLAPPVDGAGGRASADWPGVVLLDPHRLLGSLHDQDRAALSVVLGALRRHHGWQRVTVALAPDPGSVPLAARDLTSPDLSASLTLVATGSGAASATMDPEVIAGAQKLGAALSAESPTVFVAETTITLKPSYRALSAG